MPSKINIAGTWRDATTQWMNVAGTWRKLITNRINVSGTFRDAGGGKIIVHPHNAWIDCNRASFYEGNWYYSTESFIFNSILKTPTRLGRLEVTSYGGSYVYTNIAYLVDLNGKTTITWKGGRVREGGNAGFVDISVGVCKISDITTQASNGIYQNLVSARPQNVVGIPEYTSLTGIQLEDILLNSSSGYVPETYTVSVETLMAKSGLTASDLSADKVVLAMRASQYTSGATGSDTSGWLFDGFEIE